jgi:hypothetical protein
MKIRAGYYAGASLALLIVSLGNAPHAEAQLQMDRYPAATVTITPPQSQEAAKTVQNAMQAYQVELHRKAIVDADRLQQLATQLKEAIHVSTPGTLPADVIKRAEEIEKLARKVKKEAQA